MAMFEALRKEYSVRTTETDNNFQVMRLVFFKSYLRLLPF